MPLMVCAGLESYGRCLKTSASYSSNQYFFELDFPMKNHVRKVAPPGLKHSKVSKKSSSGSKNKGQKFGNFSGW